MNPAPFYPSRVSRTRAWAVAIEAANRILDDQLEAVARERVSELPDGETLKRAIRQTTGRHV